MGTLTEKIPHPANAEVVGVEVPVLRGERCASCGEPVGLGGAFLSDGVAFCAECARRSRPDASVELGVVD